MKTLLWTLLVLSLLLLLGAAVVGHELAGSAPWGWPGFHGDVVTVTVDDEVVTTLGWPEALATAGGVTLAALVVGLVLLLVVPLVVVLILLAVAAALVFSLGLPLLALGGVGLLLAAPFLAVGALLWLLLRKPARHPPAPQVTHRPQASA